MSSIRIAEQPSDSVHGAHNCDPDTMGLHASPVQLHVLVPAGRDRLQELYRPGAGAVRGLELLVRSIPFKARTSRSRLELLVHVPVGFEKIGILYGVESFLWTGVFRL
eukprot:82408-Prorocentrum_minimum.AAC.2